ncbi:MAG: hypothetical protein KVP17_001630 [Porospora cf. gigantea B]|uniref:uncharacterized protein n=1 Tax=Porospora cf. gigantea B TaxID=2853592 RepID=UPI00357183DE|nr:MAG: hypothetical protein KVP17_001630 [Porospora cf. gigantea B]
MTATLDKRKDDNDADPDSEYYLGEDGFYYQYYIEDENGEWTTVSPSKVDVSQAQLKSQPPEDPVPFESTVYPHQEAANKDLSPYSVEQVMRRVYVKATPEKGSRQYFLEAIFFGTAYGLQGAFTRDTH